MRILGLLILIPLILGLTVKSHDPIVPEGFMWAHMMNDAALDDETDPGFWCHDREIFQALVGEGCVLAEDVVLTEFNVTVQKVLNTTTEEGVFAITLNLVRETSSDIAVGGLSTAVCDRIYPLGASDINMEKDSCTVFIDIAVSAGTRIAFMPYPGSTAMTESRKTIFYVKGYRVP